MTEVAIETYVLYAVLAVVVATLVIVVYTIHTDSLRVLRSESESSKLLDSMSVLMKKKEASDMTMREMVNLHKDTLTEFRLFSEAMHRMTENLEERLKAVDHKVTEVSGRITEMSARVSDKLDQNRKALVEIKNLNDQTS